MPTERVFAACAALLGILGCADAPSGPPHIVLFTVDTLRADHLSLAGYPRATTPNVDAFAADAWYFEQALTVIPKTAPSFATLFTGRHPREHAVRSNFAQIPTKLPVLAEMLQQAGYRTAAFVGNPALRETKGFARGFDVYEIVPSQKDGVESLLEAYFTWATAAWDRPTFVWIHTLDPHGPYRPPPDYEQRFLDDEWGRDQTRVPNGYTLGPHPNKVLGSVPKYQQRIDGEDRIARYVARYDAEIRLVDDAFGRVVEDLRNRDRYDDSALIFTSDHGESLGEHDFYFEHGWFAYEAGLRIPLLLKTPGQWRSQRVATPVSNLDLLPTISALAGIAIPPGARGRNLLAGALPEATIVVESSNRYPDKFTGLRTSSEKYLRSERSGHEELYDLALDPGETQNLAEARPERTRALRERLDAELAVLRDGAVTPEVLGEDDPETLERLRELGYGE